MLHFLSLWQTFVHADTRPMKSKVNRMKKNAVRQLGWIIFQRMPISFPTCWINQNTDKLSLVRKSVFSGNFWRVPFFKFSLVTSENSATASNKLTDFSRSSLGPSANQAEKLQFPFPFSTNIKLWRQTCLRQTVVISVCRLL